MIAGLDLGTTGSKIVIYDENGNFVDRFYQSYKTSREIEGVNEIDGVELFSAVKDIVKKACCKYKIDSIGVDSFGEAFVLLDENDEPLAPIILLTDYRGRDEVEELVNSLGREKIKSITGVNPHQMFSLPKIMWIKKTQKELFSKVKRICLMEDYIIYKFTGQARIDYSLATRTLAFDINKLDYSDEILNFAGIDKSLFSTPVPLFTNCGTLKESLVKEFGIDFSPIFTPSGHDQVAVAIGSGVFDKKVAVDGSGTVECVTPVYGKEAKQSELIDNGYAIVPYVLKDTFVTYAFSYTSGSLIDWFMNTFAKNLGENAFETLEKEFKDTPSPLLVLPYFQGAATPLMDDYAKGAIVGLTLSSSLSSIYQAVLEGIAYEMRFNVETLKQYGINIDSLVATGGGSSSRKWLQIKADILNLPIHIMSDKESGSRGSAICGAIATGRFTSLDEAVSIMVKKVGIIEPNLENHERYNKMYEKYKRMYSSLKGIF